MHNIILFKVLKLAEHKLFWVYYKYVLRVGTHVQEL